MIPLADLSPEERSAVRTLQRLAKRWPSTLWLHTLSGSLAIMKKGPDGQRVTDHQDEYDQDYTVADLDIENDGSA